MARHLVRLKVSLLRASVRQSGTTGLIGLGIAIAVAIAAGTGMAFGLALLRDASDQVSADLVAILFAGLVAIWTIGPIGTVGSDGAMEPSRLRLLPIPAPQMMSGLLGAALVGFGGLTTVIALVGVFVGMAPSSGLAAITLMALLVLLATCAALSRLVATAISAAARSRRWRDFALIVGPMLVVTFGLGTNPLIAWLDGKDLEGGDLSLPPLFSAFVHALPSGPTAVAVGAAREGDVALAVTGLLGGMLWLGALLGCWWLVLRRVMTTSFESAQTKPALAEGGLFGGVLGFLPRTRLGAVAAKDMRLAWRETRQRAQIIANVIAALFPLVSMRFFGTAGVDLVFLGVLPAALLGASATNLYGFDGRAYWVHVSSGDVSGHDLADLQGKALARLAVAVPISVATIGVLVLDTGAFRLAIPALALSLAALSVTLGFSMFTSVRFPVPVPDNPTNVFSTGGTGKGAETVIPGLAAMAIAAIMIGPLGVYGAAVSEIPSALLGVTMAALSLAVVGWSTGVRAAAKWGPAGPELLSNLRQA